MTTAFSRYMVASDVRGTGGAWWQNDRPSTISVNALQGIVSGPASAQGVVRDIRVEGNRRVEPETVRSYLQFSVGQPYDAIARHFAS